MPIFLYFIKWFLVALLVGLSVGSLSALFLVSLSWVTAWREANVWIIVLLPLGGMVIGIYYHYWGSDVVKGNNKLLEEYHQPTAVIPLKMAPFVFFGTLITHFFGGSAGREGTAVQMGGAVADQCTRWFNMKNLDRSILIAIGVSAGFASVFGTPLAGAVFALEVFTPGKVRYDIVLPSFMAAFIADYTCHTWGVAHTQYSIPLVPNMTPTFFFWTIFCGICFGIAAMLSSKSTHFFSNVFNSQIKYPPLRPVVGGAIVAAAVYFVGTTKYIGLGIPTILEAFEIPLNSYDFVVKILFTSITLGAGFKGGEVTPLFFIGAALGNALVWLVPLPLALLAGMGFAAVFSGATNTPIACTLMGMELFGVECGLFIGFACVTAYFFSGQTGIYASQIVGGPKHWLYSLFATKNNADNNQNN